MARYGHLYSAYLKAADLDTGPLDVTIEQVKAEKPGKDDEREKLVIYVKEDPRGLVLNKTRYNSCCELFGSDDTDKWVGGKVKLIQIPQSFAGRQCKGIAIVPQ